MSDAHECYRDGCDCYDYRLSLILPELLGGDDPLIVALSFMRGLEMAVRHPEWAQAVAMTEIHAQVGPDADEYEEWMATYDRIVELVPVR